MHCRERLVEQAFGPVTGPVETSLDSKELHDVAFTVPIQRNHHHRRRLLGRNHPDNIFRESDFGKFSLFRVGEDPVVTTVIFFHVPRSPVLILLPFLHPSADCGVGNVAQRQNVTFVRIWMPVREDLCENLLELFLVFVISTWTMATEELVVGRLITGTFNGGRTETASGDLVHEREVVGTNVRRV